MAKIGIDARLINTSTGRYIEKLLEYLQHIDGNNRYIILLSPEDYDSWTPNKDNFEKQLCKYRKFSFGEQYGFVRQLYSLRPDLVHFTMTQQPVLYKRNKLTTIHDLTTARFNNPAKFMPVFKLKQLVYKRVIKSAAKNSRVLIAPSRFVKNDIADFTGVSPGKIAVIYEAADRIKQAAEPLPRLVDKRYIMYVGRALPHKNLPRLVAAFELLTKKYPELYLVLAGKTDANYKKISELVTKKRLAHSVVFSGHVSEGELRWLYENTAAYVFPSLSEGFGLPGLEAMAHGAPVVSSNATCLPEIYGDAAVYFDPTSVKDMARQIDKVLSDPRRRASLIIKGRAQAAKYSWKRMAQQTLRIYEAALK